MADAAMQIDGGGTPMADAAMPTDASTADSGFPGDVTNGCLRFSGSLADDATISLEAVGSATFGGAPAIYLYTDFRDQTAGTDWDGELEKVDSRLAFNSASSGLVAAGRGSGKALALGSLGTRSMIRISSMPATTNVFISRALKIMTGATWFGSSGWPSGSPQQGVFPSDSAFKMAWLMSKEGSYGTVDNNLCLPTHWSGHSLGIGGNSHNFSGASASVEAVSVSGWSLIEGWVRAEPANVTSGNGDGYVGVYSDAINSIRAELKGTVFSPGHPGRSWIALNLPGWVDTNGSDGVLETDLYVADGAQRVLLADHPHLALASKVIMLPHDSWSDRTITAKLRLAGLIDPASDPVYIHVFDADNRPLCEPLALANAVVYPQGTPTVVGSATATGRAWVGSGSRFYLVPQSYQAQTGDVGISALMLSTEAGLHSVVSVAVYESATDDWRTARRVAEVKVRPPAIRNVTVGGNAGQQFEVPIAVSLIPGRYYFRAVTITTPYDHKGTSGGNVLISSTGPPQGECPDDPTSLSMAAAGYPLALSMTVVRP